MYILKRLAVLLSIVVLAGVSLTLAGVLPAEARGNETREYQWFAGEGVIDFPALDGLLCDLGIPCPDVATASNGDTIVIEGHGTLSVHPKSVTGGGTFTHNFAEGSGSGTWEAIELLSFKSYGSNVPGGLPASFEAGKAIIRVHLVAGEMEAHGILTVGCLLGGPSEPGGAFEGVRLNLQGGPNFNKPDVGATLFIRQ